MKGRFTRSLTGALAMALLAAGAPSLATGPTDADLMGDAASTGDVLTYGMSPQGHRFSPLTTLNAVLCLSIKVRTKLRKGCKFTELSEIKL